MVSDEQFFDLPEDPQLAFIHLERQFRAELDEKLKNLEQHEPVDGYYLDYINRTLASARALTIDALEKWDVPEHSDGLWDEYRRFRTEVEHYIVQIKIHHSRRNKVYSVALDPATKQKIRHHLNQIKEAIDPIDLRPAKKEALYAAINALLKEVDRDRTGYESWAGLSIEVATTAGEVAKELTPIRGWIDSIARLLGYAKDAENARPSLPAPHETKRLTSPRRQLPPPEKRPPPGPDLDDEIPF